MGKFLLSESISCSKSGARSGVDPCRREAHRAALRSSHAAVKALRGRAMVPARPRDTEAPFLKITWSERGSRQHRSRTLRQSVQNAQFVYCFGYEVSILFVGPHPHYAIDLLRPDKIAPTLALDDTPVFEPLKPAYDRAS